MKEILDSLSRVVEQTIARFAAKHPGCRFALDCNADHDEHVRYTTARLRWAFNGPPSPTHARLVLGPWDLKEEKLRHSLGFFHDHQFVNHVVPFDDPSCTIEAAGDWRLSEGSLVMTMFETNWEKVKHLLWKDVSYELLRVDDRTLEYRDDEGTIWAYTRSIQPGDQAEHE